MRFFATALALAAPLVSAIEFTSPAVNSTVSKGSSQRLTWNSVDTDPSTFSILLVNFVNWPPSYTLLAQNIETSAGAASVEVPCSTDNSNGYQFNAINGTNVFVIYAQTPKFSVSGGACTDPTPVPPAMPSACAPPSTVTVTVSKTLSKNSTTTATGGISAAQITASASVSASSSQTTSAPTFHGTCPDTVGWASDYNHPVTLAEPPHHPEDPRYPQPTKAP
ncbi:Ser-Thr-rich glycosyl-phosphatidyl-inositol-anchored membrane family-domain-containing protein, partial [Colletotrichum cereale]